jgi:hypothetical protein
MSELPFRELRGDYVENRGQSLNLGEYLDYFEPLGSALSRLPDGRGGPFIHRFTDSAGRTISSMGWVVSAASKRFGGWTLRGLWSDRPIPTIALPLLWSHLSDSDLPRRANADAERLFDDHAWPELFDELQTSRLHDDTFRDALKSQLSRAWEIRPPYDRPIELEVTDHTLDLLPWLYLLGPVDPAVAQLKPSRFNGAGYQYILSDAPPVAAEVLREIDKMVDTAAGDAFAAWQMAEELRARRARLGTTTPATRPHPQPETLPMRRQTRPTRPAPSPPSSFSWTPAHLTPLYQLAVLALLAWLAWNVNEIRKGMAAQRAVVPQVTEVAAPETPPREIAARTAVEIFIRRNACYTPRSEPVDGQFSSAEERAIRACAALQTARLMSGGEPDQERAIAWLQGVGSTTRKGS